MSSSVNALVTELLHGGASPQHSRPSPQHSSPQHSQPSPQSSPQFVAASTAGPSIATSVPSVSAPPAPVCAVAGVAQPPAESGRRPAYWIDGDETLTGPVCACCDMYFKRRQKDGSPCTQCGALLMATHNLKWRVGKCPDCYFGLAPGHTRQQLRLHGKKPGAMPVAPSVSGALPSSYPPGGPPPPGGPHGRPGGGSAGGSAVAT